MIKIILNGEELDLGRENTIKLKVSSPLFSNVAIPSPFTFPFSIPKTSHNLRVLGWPNTLNNVVKFREDRVLIVTLFLAGSPYFKCGLTILTVADKISIKLSAILANYAQIKDKSIRTLDMGSGNVGATPLTTMLATTTQTVDDTPYVFAPLRNDGLINGNVSGIINAFDPNTEEFIGSSSPEDYSICPFVYVRHVFDRIFSLAGLQFNSDFMDDAEIKSLVFYNATTKLLSFNNALYQRGITIARHLPDISVTELFNEFQKFWRLGFFFDFKNDSQLFIKTLQEVLLDTEVVDLTEFFPDFEIGYDEFNSNGYTLTQLRDTNDKFPSKTNLVYVFENGLNQDEFKIDHPFLRLWEQSNIGSGPFFWRIPRVEQDFSDIEYGITIPAPEYPVYIYGEFRTRFMFYRGMVAGNVGHYPYLSTSDVNDLGVSTYNRSLQWTGPNGLWEKHHKDYYELLYSTKKVSKTLFLPVALAVKLRPDIKVKIKTNRFLIKSFDLEMRKSGVDFVKVTLELFLIT